MSLLGLFLLHFSHGQPSLPALMHWWDFLMIHFDSPVPSAHLLLSFALFRTAFPYILSHYWQDGTPNKQILICPPPCFHVCVCLFFYLKSEERVQISENHLKFLALNTSVFRLCFTGLNELTDIWKGKQLEWFHLGLWWHYKRSILLLCCVDIGLQSL